MSKLNIDQKNILTLFSDKKSDFLIPDYQRPYAWEDTECQTLWDDIFEFAIPDTILHGNAYMNLPVARAENGNIIYNNAVVNLATKPSTEYTLKYKNLSATYVNNNGYQDEVIVMAKTKFAF